MEDPNVPVVSFCYDCKAAPNEEGLPEPVMLCPLHAAAWNLAQVAPKAEHWLAEIRATLHVAGLIRREVQAEELLSELRAAIARASPPPGPARRPAMLEADAARMDPTAWVAADAERLAQAETAQEAARNKRIIEVFPDLLAALSDYLDAEDNLRDTYNKPVTLQATTKAAYAVREKRDATRAAIAKAKGG